MRCATPSIPDCDRACGGDEVVTTPVQSERLRIPRVLEQTRVVAILRRTEAALAVETAEALLRGGISVIEVTLNTPGALDMLRAMRDAVGDRAVLGAGRVRDIQSADEAL